jgi:peroxiredoxin
MVNFYNAYKEQGIVILGVNLTNSEQSPESVPQFLKDYNISYPVLMDKKGEIGDRYRITAIPTSYILDSNGKITEIITGPLTYQAMETLTNTIP